MTNYIENTYGAKPVFNPTYMTYNHNRKLTDKYEYKYMYKYKYKYKYVTRAALTPFPTSL